MKAALPGAPSPAMSPGYVAYQALHIGFTLIPIVAGIDKFFDRLTNWEQYLSPAATALFPGDVLMLVIGVGEILGGVLVAVEPRLGARVMIAWLLAIIINLLMLGSHYDIALRDFGLVLGALALTSLSQVQPRLE